MPIYNIIRVEGSSFYTYFFLLNFTFIFRIKSELRVSYKTKMNKINSIWVEIFQKHTISSYELKKMFKFLIHINLQLIDIEFSYYVS